MNYEKVSELLKALGHPVRLKMLCGLMESEGCHVNRIVEKLHLPQSTVSQHLAVLRGRGIIVPEKKGVKTCYKVVDKRVIELVNLLSR